MPTALVCGVTGQDGAYLARHLLERGYRVVGTSRDAQVASWSRLQRLGIAERVAMRSMNLTDIGSVLKVLAGIGPDEIYNLAGQTSVGLSFEQPREAMESIATGTLNLLEAMRFLGLPARLYNACSSECFGDTGDVPANEETPFRPRSPYATAKAAAFWQVRNYREAYGMFAASGILFNHESPLRPARFVTRKIVAGACAIARGEAELLQLGDIEVARDWGWAPDYVDAMWRMLQQERGEDFVIATGRTVTLREFVAMVFAELGLDWRRHVWSDPELLRPTDIRASRGDPAKAARVLGWRARHDVADVARLLVAAERAGTPG